MIVKHTDQRTNVMTAMDIAATLGKHVHLEGDTFAAGLLSRDTETGMYVLKRDGASDRVVFKQEDVISVSFQRCVHIHVTSATNLS